jgi:hypothetical protein
VAGPRLQKNPVLLRGGRDSVGPGGRLRRLESREDADEEQQARKQGPGPAASAVYGEERSRRRGRIIGAKMDGE